MTRDSYDSPYGGTLLPSQERGYGEEEEEKEEEGEGEGRAHGQRTNIRTSMSPNRDWSGMQSRGRASDES